MCGRQVHIIPKPQRRPPSAGATPTDRLACSVYQIHFHLHTKLGPLPPVNTRGVTSCKLWPWWGARTGAVVVNADYVKLFETTRICNSFDFWLCFPQITLPLIYLYTSQLFKHSCTMKCLLLLTLRRLMSYIYMEHPFLTFLDHTQRHSTVGPLDEWSARRRDLYLTTHDTHNR